MSNRNRNSDPWFNAVALHEWARSMERSSTNWDWAKACAHFGWSKSQFESGRTTMRALLPKDFLICVPSYLVDVRRKRNAKDFYFLSGSNPQWLYLDVHNGQEYGYTVTKLCGLLDNQLKVMTSGRVRAGSARYGEAFARATAAKAAMMGFKLMFSGIGDQAGVSRIDEEIALLQNDCGPAIALAYASLP